MNIPIALRDDFGAVALRRVAKATKNTKLH